ncbi:MAG: translation initiation factor IF-3, partial [Saprospiraceae bacterium]
MRRRRKPVLPQKKEDEYKINRNIRIPRIRLVGDNMEEISEAAGSKIEPEIYDTRDAQKWAQDMGLDLVEISPKADPPVCKITDYN